MVEVHDRRLFSRSHDKRGRETIGKGLGTEIFSETSSLEALGVSVDSIKNISFVEDLPFGSTALHGGLAWRLRELTRHHG